MRPITYEDYQLVHRTFPIALALDNVETHQNVGAIFRIADTLGVESLALCGETPKPPHKQLSRAARGSERHVAHAYFETTLAAIADYRSRGYKILALEITDESQDIKTLIVNNLGKVLLIAGSESKGIDQAVLDAVDGAVHIPTVGFCLSMNVATSVGIAVYEMTRQLNQNG
jgi:tRNA G18 (ribose-2'-O)-methylase SpoU